MMTPRHRLADSADTKEKCSLLFGFARDRFLLKRKGHFSLVFCPPSIRAGGGTGLNLISQRKSWNFYPALSFALVLGRPKPPFRFSFSQTERERKQAGKNSFPPTPSLFARLLGLRPQNFSADGRRDIFILQIFFQQVADQHL